MERYKWIDTAKCIGIFLIAFSHFIEFLIISPQAQAQWKFQIAFNVIVFFFLSGLVSKERSELSKKQVLRRSFLVLIIPVIFFNLINAVLGVVLGLAAGTFNAKYFILQLLLMCVGYPTFNIPCWFLICFFMFEIVHSFIGKYMDSDIKLLIGIAFFMALGLGISTLPRGNIVKYFTLWIVPYGFYLSGMLFRKRLPGFFAEMTTRKRLLAAGIFLAAVVIHYFTFDLNHTHPKFHDVIGMLIANYGHPFYFLLSGYVGIAIVISLAALIPSNRAASFIGFNSLAFFCLNGVFFHFINPPLAQALHPHISRDPVLFLLSVSAVTILTVFATMPFVYLLDRYLPQLIGRPFTKGPILNRE